MSYPTVEDVMTEDVVTVSPSTSFKEVARLLTDHHVSAVPVVDEDRRPVGIVSEADLLLKEELADTPHQPAGVPALDRWGHGPARYKAAAVCAGEAMTSPVVTLRAGMSVNEAARVFHARRLRHAPVVDDSGRLVGIVARSDLLRPFVRDDDALRFVVVTEVLDALFDLPSDAVQVDVADGVVTLRGRLGRRSEVDAVRQAVEAQPGVVAVVDRLTYLTDDM